MKFVPLEPAQSPCAGPQNWKYEMLSSEFINASNYLEHRILPMDNGVKFAIMNW